MLITFKTKGYSDIIMFGEVALKLLHIMGHSGTCPGAFSADEVENAYQALDNATRSMATDLDDKQVDLRKRAVPLLEMLKYATQEHLPVIFE